MIRFKAIIEYDGTNFCGMQKQQDHQTIQGEIESALEIILKRKTEISFSGRTDAGVHALGQVISFDIEESFYHKYNNKSKKIEGNFNKNNIDSPITFLNLCENVILNGVNFFLSKKGIVIIQICKTENNFDPRKWAIQRTYLYKISNRKAPLVIDINRKWHVPFILDINHMKQAGNYFIGRHDFTSFRSKECTAPNPIRTIDLIDIYQDKYDISITISAKSFLHKMVRNIVGTLVEFGKNPDIPAETISQIILAKDRSKAFVTAPACGLYFHNVKY